MNLPTLPHPLDGRTWYLVHTLRRYVRALPESLVAGPQVDLAGEIDSESNSTKIWRKFEFPENESGQLVPARPGMDSKACILHPDVVKTPPNKLHARPLSYINAPQHLTQLSNPMVGLP